MTVEEAKRVLRAEYYGDVRSTAEELIEACKSGEIADREALFDRIHEECDGSAWIIYTANAQQVLMFSDNDDAGIEELGADSFDWKNGIPWSQLAFYAMERDVFDMLDALGLDVNDDASWREGEGEDTPQQ
jgi:hypothetical protein